MKNPISFVIMLLSFFYISGSYVKIQNKKIYIRKNGISSFFEINMTDITDKKEENNSIVIKTKDKEYKIKRCYLSSKDYEEIKLYLLKKI